MLENKSPFTLLDFSRKNGTYFIEYDMQLQSATQRFTSEFVDSYHDLNQNDKDSIFESLYNVGIILGDKLNPHLGRATIRKFILDNYEEEIFHGEENAMIILENNTFFKTPFDAKEVLEKYQITGFKFNAIQSAVTFSLSTRVEDCSAAVKFKLPPMSLEEETNRGKQIDSPFTAAVILELTKVQQIIQRWVIEGVKEQSRQLDLFAAGKFIAAVGTGNLSPAKGEKSSDDDGEGLNDGSGFLKGMTGGLLDDEAAGETFEKERAEAKK